MKRGKPRMSELYYDVEFVGGRQAGLHALLTHPCVEIHRPIQFRGAGIFAEVYEVTSIMGPFIVATYRGLRRSRELARHFDPDRITW